METAIRHFSPGFKELDEAIVERGWKLDDECSNNARNQEILFSFSHKRIHATHLEISIFKPQFSSRSSRPLRFFQRLTPLILELTRLSNGFFFSGASSLESSVEEGGRGSIVKISRVYTAIKQAVSPAETWNYVRSTSSRHKFKLNGCNYAVKRSGQNFTHRSRSARRRIICNFTASISRRRKFSVNFHIRV